MYILQTLNALRERVVSFFFFMYSSCYLKSQLLKTKGDLKKFKQQYEADSGNHVSLKTLKHSKRVLMFSDYHGNIVAQYFIHVALITKSLYLKDVCNSEKGRKKIVQNAGLKAKVKVSEIAAFSIRRTTGSIQKIRVIVTAILDASRKKSSSYVLAGSFLPFFQEQLKWVLPVELFGREFSYHGKIRYGKIFIGSKKTVKFRLLSAIYKRLLYELRKI
jgi:hypothetical protein